MPKDADAYRTISEVAEALDVPPHVLRFWETKFTQIKPLKRGGGRRYYARADLDLLRAIRRLLYEDAYTIRGVQRLLRAQGPGAVAAMPPRALRGESQIEAEPAGPAMAEFAGYSTADLLETLAADLASCRTILSAALATWPGRRSGA